MVGLAEGVASWMGRMELMARGLEQEHAQARTALRDADPLEARRLARMILRRVPSSPVALALWADAARAASLDDEYLEALRRLCEAAPWTATAWLRLAEQLAVCGAHQQAQDALLRSLDAVSQDAQLRERIVLALTDADLRRRDYSRAERWLAGAAANSPMSTEVARRWLAVAVARGDVDTVRRLLGQVGPPELLDELGVLAFAGARWLVDAPDTVLWVLRAFILEAPGADDLVASFLVNCRQEDASQILVALRAARRAEEPRFTMAMAMREPDSGQAIAALERAAQVGDQSAAMMLYRWSLSRRDPDALLAAIAVLGDDAEASALSLASGADAHRRGDLDGAVRAWVGGTYDGQQRNAVLAWFRQSFAEQVDTQEPLDGLSWALAWLLKAALHTDDWERVAACERLQAELSRPLRVAVVGEFNAGKSSFINALLGAEVAPTGVVPTTAYPHWLSWAPDEYARIERSGDVPRVISHDLLRETLSQLVRRAERIESVHIYAPHPWLRHLQMLDTPGFNASDPQHQRRASLALEQAHVALWITDATQPLKNSERVVLEQIRALDMPVMVLVNKSDRVPVEDRPRVIAYVQEGLRSLDLRRLGDPLLFSARDALTAVAVDADEGRSVPDEPWAALEEALEEALVAQSSSLLKSVVRARAARIAREIAKELSNSGDEAGVEVKRHKRDELLARLRSIGEPDRTLDDAIHGAVSAWQADLAPLKANKMSMTTANVADYVWSRCAVRLMDGVISWMVGNADVSDRDQRLVAGAVRDTLRGGCMGMRRLQDAEGFVTHRLVRACVLSALERLDEEPLVSPLNRPASSWELLADALHAVLRGEMHGP